MSMKSQDTLFWVVFGLRGARVGSMAGVGTGLNRGPSRQGGAEIGVAGLGLGDRGKSGATVSSDARNATLDARFRFWEPLKERTCRSQSRNNATVRTQIVAFADGHKSAVRGKKKPTRSAGLFGLDWN